MSPRYERQVLLPWIGESGQSSIARAAAGVVGLGALGSVSSAYLARAGVGRLVLVDRDHVQEGNLHRQVLYDEADCRERLPKAVAAQRHLRAARGDLRIEAHVADLDSELARHLFAACDVVVDGTDNFETRYLLNDAAVESRTPWVYGGAVSDRCSVMAIRPGETACLCCLFPDPPPPGSAPTCETAGILGPAAGLAASLQAAEALKILAGRAELCSGGLLTADLKSWAVGQAAVARDPDCPCCGQGRFEFLDGRAVSATHRLCGRDGIMVLAPKGTRMELEGLRERLSALAPVFANEYLLQTVWEGHPVTLYADGRALIQKTDDPARARALYARYLGI